LLKQNRQFWKERNVIRSVRAVLALIPTVTWISISSFAVVGLSAIASDATRFSSQSEVNPSWLVANVEEEEEGSPSRGTGIER
jgi:hypothetical protein